MNTEIKQMIAAIETLDVNKARVKDVATTLNDIIETLNVMAAAPEVETKQRNVLKSTKAMTREIAHAILYGRYVNSKVKEIAQLEGLSYGQVYSVKGGYTFTSVKESDFPVDVDVEDDAKASEELVKACELVEGSEDDAPVEAA